MHQDLSRFMPPECQLPVNDRVVEKGTSTTPVREDELGTKGYPPAPVELNTKYLTRLSMSISDRSAMRYINSPGEHCGQMGAEG